jgi:hypothetical protein
MSFELREINSSKVFKTGSIWPTNNSGDVEILGQINKVHLRKNNPKLSSYPYFAVKILEDGTIVRARRAALKNGKIKNPNKPNVLGVGFIGEGDAVCYVSNNNTREYNAWHSMITRCHCPKYQALNPSYIGCSIDPRWHSFNNFWNDIKNLENYDRWKLNIEKMELDKDLKILGNKLYSKDTCMFVTEKENIGERNIRASVTGKTYVAVRISDNYREIFFNHSVFAKNNNLIRACISHCISGTNKTHRGWRFETLDE